MRDQKFICFIGIDGSGKTTLAKSVVRALSEEDSFVYVHSLIEARLLKPFMKLGRWVFAKGKSKEKNYREFSKEKRSRFSKHRILFPFYKFFLFLDYTPQVFRKVTLPILRGKKLVSDRYVYDTLINMGLNMNYDASRIAKSINAFFRFFPRPDITFLIDVPEEVAFSRKDDIPDIEYLRERRHIYLALAEIFHMHILDGTKPLGVLTQEVLEKMRRSGE
ncbi:MAG: thymidylate kinase [Candidatus Marinimicrobia bacterium]|nr:thymidylate kinase [Candidatus Neomarinimicrobiota bacterium]